MLGWLVDLLHGGSWDWLAVYVVPLLGNFWCCCGEPPLEQTECQHCIDDDIYKCWAVVVAGIAGRNIRDCTLAAIGANCTALNATYYIALNENPGNNNCDQGTGVGLTTHTYNNETDACSSRTFYPNLWFMSDKICFNFTSTDGCDSAYRWTLTKTADYNCLEEHYSLNSSQGPSFCVGGASDDECLPACNFFSASTVDVYPVACP